jgi:crotonobetaine/carnitine-CoA ligase
MTALALPPAERTLAALLERQGAALGARPCLTIGDVRLSYAETRDAAAAYAGVLAGAGVAPGDRVAVLSENRWELLALWLGCAWLGAVFVPVNTATRGPQLAHILSNAGPRVLAGEPGLLPHLGAIEAHVPELERIWSFGAPEGAWQDVAVEPFPQPGRLLPPGEVRPGDTVAILYTSGTTGPSKGVMCPQAQCYWWGVNTGALLGLREDDVLYTCLPLFHTNALNTLTQALVHGARLAVGPRFSASRFWERLAASEATVTYLLGAMVSILAKREPGPFDRAHSARIALAPATPAALHELFAERFGLALADAYGMTETNAVIGSPGGAQRPGSMGRVLPGFEARVVDEEDSPVLDGTAGELVMRADEPWAFATGYWRMPEETARAWRNLWFHSGDRVVREPDGTFRFLDRLKDAIRRRGENVSAWEVEQVLQQHPDVAAAAVFPVPSELGEDEVMAAVVPRPEASLDPAELVRWCEPRLASFAIPRYVDVVAELPLTENGKVRKFLLRQRGVGLATWDREGAGAELRR